jgi:hypothetical protein
MRDALHYREPVPAMKAPEAIALLNAHGTSASDGCGPARYFIISHVQARECATLIWQQWLKLERLPVLEAEVDRLKDEALRLAGKLAAVEAERDQLRGA